MHSNRKTAIAKNIVFIVGIFCALIFFITKSAFLLKFAALSDTAIGTRYGDLYQHARIPLFKEYLWRGSVSKKWEAPLADADIIFLGDSYLTIEFTEDTYPHRVAERMSRPISVLEYRGSYKPA